MNGFKSDKTAVLKAQCSIDVIGAVTVLGLVARFIWAAAASDGGRCPDSTREGCGISVTGILQTLAFEASLISSCATTCAGSLSLPAMCSASISGMLAGLLGIAVGAQSVTDSCEAAEAERTPEKFRHDPKVKDFVARAMQHRGRLGRRPLPPPGELLGRRLGPAAAAAAAAAEAGRREPGAQRRLRSGEGSPGKEDLGELLGSLHGSVSTGGEAEEAPPNVVAENWRKATCGLEITFFIDMVMSAVLRIVAMANDCPEPEAICAAEISSLIGNWALFTTLATGVDEDCTDPNKTRPEIAPV